MKPISFLYVSGCSAFDPLALEAEIRHDMDHVVVGPIDAVLQVGHGQAPVGYGPVVVVTGQHELLRHLSLDGEPRYGYCRIVGDQLSTRPRRWSRVRGRFVHDADNTPDNPIGWSAEIHLRPKVMRILDLPILNAVRRLDAV